MGFLFFGGKDKPDESGGIDPNKVYGEHLAGLMEKAGLISGGSRIHPGSREDIEAKAFSEEYRKQGERLRGRGSGDRSALFYEPAQKYRAGKVFASKAGSEEERQSLISSAEYTRSGSDPALFGAALGNISAQAAAEERMMSHVNTGTWRGHLAIGVRYRQRRKAQQWAFLVRRNGLFFLQLIPTLRPLNGIGKVAHGLLHRPHWPSCRNGSADKHPKKCPCVDVNPNFRHGSMPQ